jgi:hypothetical protein
MMGRRERGQGQFFYAFDLDKVVPVVARSGFWSLDRAVTAVAFLKLFFCSAK